MQVRAYAYNKSMNSGYGVRFYYKILKEHVLKWAMEQPDEMGKDLVMTMEDDGIKYEILVKRILDKRKK